MLGWGWTLPRALPWAENSQPFRLKRCYDSGYARYSRLTGIGKRNRKGDAGKGTRLEFSRKQRQ